VEANLRQTIIASKVRNVKCVYKHGWGTSLDTDDAALPTRFLWEI